MATRWSMLAGAALLVLSGCGKVADVLNEPPSQGDGGPDGAATSAGGGHSGDPFSSLGGTPGASGVSAADAATGSAGTSAAGAGPVPDLGTGSGGATGAPPTAASGGSGVGGLTGESAGGASVIDTRAADRRSVVETYCGTCNSGPDCVSRMITETASWLPDACWNEWIASVNCSMANGCAPISGGLVGMGPCLAERDAVGNCVGAHEDDGTAKGSMGSCDWYGPATGSQCQVGCTDDVDHVYTTLCDGPPNGPFSCSCSLNGRYIHDSLVMDGGHFFTDTCKQAAQLMADGFCQKYTSCCYTFRGPRLGGQADQDLCECTSDPSAGMFANCADLAASKKEGKVVDLCPAYAYPFP